MFVFFWPEVRTSFNNLEGRVWDVERKKKQVKTLSSNKTQSVCFHFGFKQERKTNVTTFVFPSIENQGQRKSGLCRWRPSSFSSFWSVLLEDAAVIVSRKGTPRKMCAWQSELISNRPGTKWSQLSKRTPCTHSHCLTDWFFTSTLTLRPARSRRETSERWLMRRARGNGL